MSLWPLRRAKKRYRKAKQHLEWCTSVARRIPAANKAVGATHEAWRRLHAQAEARRKMSWRWRAWLKLRW